MESQRSPIITSKAQRDVSLEKSSELFLNLLCLWRQAIDTPRATRFSVACPTASWRSLCSNSLPGVHIHSPVGQTCTFSMVIESKKNLSRGPFLGKLAFLKQFSNRGGQLQHAKHVRDRRPILTYSFGDLLLGEIEFVGKPMVALPFLDRVEICALKVFDESQSQNRFIVDVLYDRRNFFPPEFRCCAKATFTGNQLESVLSGTPPDGYRLKESAGLEGFPRVPEARPD